MQTVFNTLTDLKKSVDSGEIDGSKLQIMLDNDMTSYMYDDGSDDSLEIIVESAGNGYYDYEELYKICFPNSIVEGV